MKKVRAKPSALIQPRRLRCQKGGLAAGWGRSRILSLSDGFAPGRSPARSLVATAGLVPSLGMPEAPPLQDSSALPLRWQTPVVWVAQATRDLPVFLNDHAHLERKAASNALELLNRCGVEE